MPSGPTPGGGLRGLNGDIGLVLVLGLALTALGLMLGLPALKLGLAAGCGSSRIHSSSSSPA